MQEKITKKLLIVTTSFFPENAIGAVRLSNFAKYLSQEFESVHVICPPINKNSLIDNTINFKDISNLFLHRTNHTFLFRTIKLIRDAIVGDKNPAEFVDSKFTKKTFLLNLKQRLSKFFFNNFVILKNRDFYVSAIKIFRKLNKRIEFDYLLTSYPSYASHKAGLLIKKSSKGIFWIADFRDPMIYESMESFSFFPKLQKEILINADKSLAISKGVKDRLKSYSPQAKIDVIYNGFDDSPALESMPSIDPSKLNVCYVGSLYGGKRDLSKVFEILNSFLQEKRLEKNFLQFHYAGTDFYTLHKQASRFGLENCLNNYGKISREKSLQIQFSCDFVSVATWNLNKEQGILTGKLFEAFMLKKPILGVVTGDTPDSEFKLIVKDCDAGIVIEDGFHLDDDNISIFSILNNFLNAKKSLISSKPDSIFTFKVDSFHYRNICKDLLSKI